MTTAIQHSFGAAFVGFASDRPILILAHNDADGLSAAALFERALRRIERPCRTRILGRGENPWSAAIRAEFDGGAFGGLIVADLGVRDGDVLPGLPTIIVDHHVPSGVPGAATIVSGFGSDPTPTSSLLAFHCVATFANVDDLLWLAAIGLVGDLGDKAPFPELALAKTRHTATALREVVSLVNAPRRTAAGDAGAPLALLMNARDPKDAISGRHPETAVLKQAREEVKAALEIGKRAPPRISGVVALIGLDSPLPDPSARGAGLAHAAQGSDRDRRKRRLPSGVGAFRRALGDRP